MSLDYSTVHFCSSLLNLSYGTMFLILWAKRRELALLYWALSLLLVAVASYGFLWLHGIVATSLLLGLIAFNVTLIWAGARAFVGLPPLRWKMAAIPVLVAAVHALGSWLGEPAYANAVSTLLLATNVFIVGRCFFLGPGENTRFGRKIVAGALFGYIPLYISSSSLAALMFGSEVAAVTVLVGDLVLNNIFVVGLFWMIEDRTRSALRVIAETDELTGALNRGGFLKRALGLMAGQEAPAVLIADLDHFKQINDEHGHAAGDEVLKVFVQRAHQALGQQAVIGRFGGEEFAVVLPASDGVNAVKHAEAIRLSMARDPVVWSDEAIKATVSIGVATYRRNEPFEATLRRADEALYRAKKNGRNRIAA